MCISCQACRAIKLRCVRQADGHKCARCDRLELECRFVEKKRGRKPKTHVAAPASSTPTQILDTTTSTSAIHPPAPKSPSYPHADSSSAASSTQHHRHHHTHRSGANSPTATTTFTPPPPPPPHSATHPSLVSAGPFHPGVQPAVLAQPNPHPHPQTTPEQEQLRNGVADDPVKAGLISSTEIPRLFEYFMNNCKALNCTMH